MTSTDLKTAAILARQATVYTSPVGPARYPHVEKPDTTFGSPGVYHVGVAVSDVDLAAFERTCRSVFARAFPGQTGPLVLPIKHDDAGRPFIQARTKIAPKVTTSARIRTGDLIRFQGRLRAYRHADRQGVALTVHAVHVAKS